MVNAPKRKTARRKKTYVKRMSSKSVSKIVKSTFKKMAEKKRIVQGFSSTIVGNNSASTTATPDLRIQRLDPNNTSLTINQGPQQNQRVGNKVKLVSGKLTLGIWPRADTAGNSNSLQYVRVMILYDKRNPTITPTPFANLDFFEQSSATGSTGFTGLMYDLINSINEDRYGILYDKTYKLGQAILTSSGDPNYNYSANNDFKAFHKITIPLTKKCVKNLVYKDNQTDAQWRGAWLFCYGVAASAAGNTADINIANIYGQVSWKFTDV